jgi:hypothetical protein
LKSKREIETHTRQDHEKNKKTYSPPELTRWGRIKDITKGMTAGMADGLTGTGGV